MKRKTPAGKAKPKKGRPTSYTKQLGREICRRLACGESLRHICKTKGMPAVGTVMQWLFPAVDRPGLADFQEHYARGRRAYSELEAERLVAIADEPVTSNEQVQRNRLRIDARKWVASKLLPKKYGDHQTVELQGGHDFKPVSHLELAREMVFLLELSKRDGAAAHERARPKLALTHLKGPA